MCHTNNLKVKQTQARPQYRSLPEGATRPTSFPPAAVYPLIPGLSEFQRTWTFRQPRKLYSLCNVHCIRIPFNTGTEGNQKQSTDSIDSYECCRVEFYEDKRKK
ncbi:hypothetical protein EVAR_412_1 [Eumeta japonica]|uniref:Uncharacterized protein n=1 Tax=Eumeta variegata TaxID=151549 RepID=A0A4C1SAD2_EUMVA|nr:hypothetical protein EVAR_412_1 [Eumeta japonica]